MRRFILTVGFMAAAIIVSIVAYLLFTGPHMRTQPHVRAYETLMPLPPSGAVVISREGREIDLKEMVEEVAPADDSAFSMTVRDLGEVKVRLEELLPEVFGRSFGELQVLRTGLYGWDGGWVEPLQREGIWAARS